MSRTWPLTRGKRLRALCALEHYCLIKVEQRRATDPAQVADGVNEGRTANAMFDFQPRHVLDDSNYVHYLVSQSRCPIFREAHARVARCGW